MIYSFPWFHRKERAYARFSERHPLNLSVTLIHFINGHKFPGIQQISILQDIGNKQPHVQ